MKETQAGIEKLTIPERLLKDKGEEMEQSERERKKERENRNPRHKIDKRYAF